MAQSIWHVTNDGYMKARIGAQRLKDTGTMKNAGKIRIQPLTEDWTEFPKLKQANFLGCKLYK